MKCLLLAACLFMAVLPAAARSGRSSAPRASSHSGGTVHYRGTVTRNGQYRQPHVSTAPNRTQRDNWSTKGNTNPYTGRRGSKTATR
jgi:hypothetical protein